MQKFIFTFHLFTYEPTNYIDILKLFSVLQTVPNMVGNIVVNKTERFHGFVKVTYFYERYIERNNT